LLCFHKPFIAAFCPIYSREECKALLHPDGQRFTQLVDVCDDLLHGSLVEVECTSHVVEYADVVHDEAVGLLLAEGAVSPADGLQEIMVFHRFVEIHRLQDRRIETGQQLAGDDDELQRVSRVAEAVEQFLFGVLVAGMDFPFGRIAGLADHHDGACFGIDQLIHHLLVEHTALAVEGHHLCLETVRFYPGLVVPDDVVHHGTDAFGVLHEHCHLRRPFGEIVAVLLAQGAGDLLVGFVDRSLIDL